MAGKDDDVGNVVPLYGRDEMNLVEFPFGPISATTAKTLEIEHDVWDPQLRRAVTRRMIIAGSEKWGLPRPIDDHVFLGLKTLTLDSGYTSQIVEFTRYHLCRILRWEPDGRAYARLEESLDRMKATTLKFKDAWYDNAEKQYKSKAFSIIDDYELCSRDQIDRARITGDTNSQMSFFKWSDVMWKSFQDNYIKKVDMQMYYRIAEGRRREVPLRLYRILDKRFYGKTIARFRLRRLCLGTLGLSPNYGPAQMLRVLERAINCLIDCEYLAEWWCTGPRDNPIIHFRQRLHPKSRSDGGRRSVGGDGIVANVEDSLKSWIVTQSEEALGELESEALELGFGSELERKMVHDERAEGRSILQAGRTRQAYLRRYREECESKRSGVVVLGK